MVIRVILHMCLITTFNTKVSAKMEEEFFNNDIPSEACDSMLISVSASYHGKIVISQHFAPPFSFFMYNTYSLQNLVEAFYDLRV